MDQFEVIKVQPREVGWKGKIYDLRKITLDQANKLVDENICVIRCICFSELPYFIPSLTQIEFP
jgi:hypothetical protein